MIHRGKSSASDRIEASRSQKKKIVSSVPLPLMIFICALAVRIIHIALLKEGFYFSDFKAYDRAAQALTQGQGFGPEFTRPPLYPIFLAVQYLLFGFHLFPIRFVQALLGAYSSVLIYSICRSILGKGPARVAAWISVFYPYYVFISGLLYPTLITTFLLVAMLYFMVLFSRSGSLSYLVLAALCLGLASLAVPVCLAFLPFLFVWLLFVSGMYLKRAVLTAALFLLVVGGTLAPWMHYGYKHYGQLIFIDPRVEKHLPVIQSPDAASGETDSNGYRGRLGMVLQQPGKYLGNMANEFIRFWKFVPDRVVTTSLDYRLKVHQEDERMIVNHPYTSPLMDWVSLLTYGPVFILALVGIIFCAKSWRLLSLPLLLLLSQAFGYSLFFAQTRYRLPVEFCLMILAGGGAWAIWSIYAKLKSTV